MHFSPRQPPSRAESSRLTTSWSVSLGALERWRLQLRRATLGSPVASPIWPESSPEKHVKTTPAPRLPGVITLPFELRFVQTLYRWKVDVERFPAICYMTHFEHQKASKSSPENQVRKQHARENRWGFGRGAVWWIRSPRGRRYDSRGIITRRTAWCCVRRATPLINKAPPTPPPHFRCDFARALDLLECSLGRNRGLRVYLSGFLDSF